ncbi:uncharacterized protein [Euphorbia lathyris]|uniref:uncharacterized protein n=1 Tax=Euphorbia lathyris TaxID=212925 RepID=UPI00331388FC
MPEFSLSSSTTPLKKTHFSSLLLSDLYLFCSFILSHPLYFFYFIFFSPYLFKLLSFLSPLFFTTFLLLSVFLTFSPNLLHDALTQSNLSLMLGTYQAVADKLRPQIHENGNEEEEEEDKVHQFEELDVYKIVFDTSEFDLENSFSQYPPEVEIKEEISISIPIPTTNAAAEEKKSNLEVNSVVISIECEKEEIGRQKGEKEVKVISEEHYSKRGSKGHNKVIEEESEYLPRANSERTPQSPWSYDNGEDFYSPKAVEKSPSMRSNGSFGSMRKEKEWRRTLACKLFEERHNATADGNEGMDMLWETYETDAMKLQGKSKSKRGKKGNIEFYNDEDEEEEEDEDEEENNGQLCCLQALKFSAGKMNLGMGKPNLLKISKAFKGIGWLHHVSKKKACH